MTDLKIERSKSADSKIILKFYLESKYNFFATLLTRGEGDLTPIDHSELYIWF